MASITFGVSTTSTTNTTTYASSAFTPAANDLLVVFVLGTNQTSAGSLSSSVGTTFTLVNSAAQNTSANLGMVFVANALSSATSQTVTFTGTGSPNGCAIAVYRISGMSRTGSGAIRQSQPVANHALGTPAPAFSASALTGNPTLGAIFNSTSPATMTAPTGWTEGSDAGYSTPTSGMETVWRNSGFTGTTVTWGSSSATVFAAIIVELDSSVPNSAPNAPTLSSPANTGTVASTTPTLQWSDTDPNSDKMSYEVQIDTVNTFDSQGGSVIDSYSESNANDSISLDASDNTTGTAQSFTGNGSNIGAVKFYLKKFGNPTGNATVRIYAHSGTYGTSSVPTGSALATADSTLDVSTLTTSLQLIQFNFTGPNSIALSNGTPYVVSFEYSGGDNSNKPSVGWDSTTPTHGGNEVQLFNGSWVAQSGEDLAFYVLSSTTPLIDALSSANNGFADVTTPVTPSISHVQKIGSAADNSLSSFTITPGSGTTAGNDIIVAVSWYVASGTYPTCVITDSAGNTYNTVYSVVGSSSTGPPSMLVVQAHNTSSLSTSNKITATFTGTAPFATMTAHEFSGLSTILDGSTVTASGTGTVVSFGTGTTTNAVDAVLAFVAPFGNLAAPTWSAGWSSNDWQSAGPSIGLAWQLPTSTASFSGTATIAASEAWNSALISLQGSVGDPFTSGDSVSYTVQGGSALTNGTTYYWRVRAIDPQGSNTYGSWSATDSFTVSVGGSISATGIASTAALGSPTLSPGAVTISPTGIASASALGSPTLQPGAVNISATGIASSSALGSPSLSSTYNLAPTGLASTAALGAPTLAPGGVTVSPTGIASTAALGTVTVTSVYLVSTSGIASTAVLGTPTLTPGPVSIRPTGLVSTSALGVPTLSSVYTLQATGIASTAALGTVLVALSYALNTTGIGSTAALGSPTLSPGAVTISPTGLASAAVIGSPTLVPGAVSISPTGIASTAALGTVSLTASYTLSVSGIASTAALGSPTLVPGVVSINPTGLVSTAVLGSPTLSGIYTLTVSGIASTAALGIPTVAVSGTGSQTLSVTGIVSTTAFGSPTLVPGTVIVSPTGITSALVFGNVLVAVLWPPAPGGSTVIWVPDGIDAATIDVATGPNSATWTPGSINNGTFTPVDSNSAATWIPGDHV